MNETILANLQKMINQQIPRQEAALELLFKAEAILSMGLTSDLKAHSMKTLHDYLWLLEDLIKHTLVLNQSLLDALLQAKKAGSSSDNSSGGMVYH